MSDTKREEAYQNIMNQLRSEPDAEGTTARRLFDAAWSAATAAQREADARIAETPMPIPLPFWHDTKQALTTEHARRIAAAIRAGGGE